MRKIFSFTNLLFLIFILGEMLIPSNRDGGKSQYLITLIVLIQLFYLFNLMFNGEKTKIDTIGDIIIIIYVLLFVWELLTLKLNLLDNMLYPAPGIVIALFLSELPELLKGLFSSLQLLLTGYFLALILAIPLALIIGWRKRLFRAINPLTKVLGPIPPIVYIPYAIGLLPTFKSASIFIIFIGAFWPIFINTLNGVFNIDKRIIDSAKVLNVKEKTMLFRIILPAIIPSIISGATIGLVLSFILLTAAEMIGATSGLGWYVKYFSDFADYPRVLVGIIFIGIVVTGITYIFDKVEKYLLRWKSAS